MADQMAVYERRLASGKGTAYKEECAKLREEVAALQEENSALQYEIDNLNKVASYVGSRVAKVLVGARRANNYNSSLVAELKRWNRKLEVRSLTPLWYTITPCFCSSCSSEAFPGFKATPIVCMMSLFLFCSCQP